MKTPLLKNGLQLGNYRIERLVAHGKTTEVYLARHEPSGAGVALRCASPMRQREPALAEARFRDGLARVLPMKGPNMPAVLDGGVAEGVLWLASVLKPGELVEVTPEPPLYIHVFGWVTAIIDALDAAYSKFGVIHGDLRPESIFIDDGEESNLLGIGCAELFGLTRTLARSTPLYRAPEQLTGRAPLTFQADMYSLGMILYALSAGRPPFAGPGGKLPDKLAQVALAEQGGPSLLTPLPAIRGPAAEVAWSIVRRAIHPDPEKRYASWNQMRLEVTDAALFYLKRFREERVLAVDVLVDEYERLGTGDQAREFVATSETEKQPDTDLTADERYH